MLFGDGAEQCWWGQKWWLRGWQCRTTYHDGVVADTQWRPMSARQTMKGWSAPGGDLVLHAHIRPAPDRVRPVPLIPRPAERWGCCTAPPELFGRCSENADGCTVRVAYFVLFVATLPALPRLAGPLPPLLCGICVGVQYQSDGGAYYNTLLRK